jgi:hypothetical protein
MSRQSSGTSSDSTFSSSDPAGSGGGNGSNNGAPISSTPNVAIAGTDASGNVIASPLLGPIATVTNHNFGIVGVGNTIDSLSNSSTVEGNQNAIVNSVSAHVEGSNNSVSERQGHAEGQSNQIKSGAWYSHAEGQGNQTSAPCSHVEGTNNVIGTGGNSVHVEGGSNTVSNGITEAHIEGDTNLTTGSASYSHVEGIQNTIRCSASHIEGTNNQETAAGGSGNHIEGISNTISGAYSAVHIEGNGNTASGNSSHAEGANNTASGTFSHVQNGDGTNGNTAAGTCSDVGGIGNTGNYCQFVRGKYAVIDGISNTAPTANQIIAKWGWGVSGTPQDIFQIKANGNIFFPLDKSGIQGTILATDANVGVVGEYVTSRIGPGSIVAITTGASVNVTSISLTAGDWDVEGVSNLIYSGVTMVGSSFSQGAINNVSGTVTNDGTETPSGLCPNAAGLTFRQGHCITRKRYSLSATTTIYLVCSAASFTVGTCGAYGTISARRVR